MCDELGFFARAETRAIVCLVETAAEFGDQLRRTTRERADLRAGLPMTDRSRPIGDLNRDKIRGSLALRAVARLPIHRRTGTIEDHLKAKIGVDDAALRP